MYRSNNFYNFLYKFCFKIHEAASSSSKMAYKYIYKYISFFLYYNKRILFIYLFANYNAVSSSFIKFKKTLLKFSYLNIIINIKR